MNRIGGSTANANRNPENVIMLDGPSIGMPQGERTSPYSTARLVVGRALYHMAGGYLHTMCKASVGWRC